MSQWAEIRHMFLVDGVPKKQIARRLGVDVKTVRRAIEAAQAPKKRTSPERGYLLAPFRERIEGWLQAEPRITAKRIARLLEPEAGRLRPRTVRRYVAKIRRRLFPREGFVHRTHPPGTTLEGDFFETWAEVGGELYKIKVFVAVLPASNTYFGKAYRLERLECLLDGLLSAMEYFGGVTDRAVLDNTGLAVKRVRRGREREETDLFHAFRGAFPLHVDFCAPGKGWEKGSVERGVRYLRDLVFRPRPSVGSMEELNALILAELEADAATRRLPDGRTAAEALEAEREHLRPLPSRRPETCRTVPCVVNKHGHVRIDCNTYSLPIEHAHGSAWGKIYHDRIEIAVGTEVVARHERRFGKGKSRLEPRHVLRLLEHKHRAVPEATALQSWDLPPAFHAIRNELRERTRKPDQEWVRILRLTEEHPLEDVTQAVEAALKAGTPRLETVRMLLRPPGERGDTDPVPLRRADLAGVKVAAPDLASYDHLVEEV